MTPVTVFSELRWVDGLVFGTVFALTLAVVYRARKKWIRSQSSEDRFELLLMGRKFTLPVFIASLVASWYGEISGVTAFTFENGLFSFLSQSVVWYVAYLVFVFVLIDRIPRTQASTFPELVGNHLGPRAHRVTAVLTILNMLPIGGVLSLGIFLNFLTGIPVWTSSAIGLLCLFAYALSGGLRSVVYADLVQFGAMVSAVILVAVFSMITHGSPSLLSNHLPPTHLEWLGGKGFSELFIWMFIAFSTLVDPLFYQRTLAAKDVRQAKWGILGATLVWFIFDCAAVTGALYARAYRPELAPNESYLRYSIELLPFGFKGFFLAGIFSALVSSLDSHLFSSASMISFDLADPQKFNKRKLQWSMVLTGGLTLMITPFFDSIATVWKVMGSFSSSCLLFPWLLMLLFPGYKSESRFLMSVGSGVACLILGSTLQFMGSGSVDLFYWGLLGSSVGFWVSLALFRTKAL